MRVGVPPRASLAAALPRRRPCARPPMAMRWSVGTRRRLAGSTDEPMHTCSSSSSSTEARDACAHVIGVRRRMHKNRKRAGCSRVVRVRASRRRTHKLVSADSPLKAFSGIAVIRLLLRYLRARDEAPRQSSEAPCDVSQAAWRGVDARERAGHNRACESACRLEPRSLLRCRVAVRARARRWRCDGAWGHDDGSPDRPTSRCIHAAAAAAARRRAMHARM